MPKYQKRSIQEKPRDYRLKVWFELLLEYLREEETNPEDLNTTQLTLYDFQKRINTEYENTTWNDKAKYIWDRPDYAQLHRLEMGN